MQSLKLSQLKRVRTKPIKGLPIGHWTTPVSPCPGSFCTITDDVVSFYYPGEVWIRGDGVHLMVQSDRSVKRLTPKRVSKKAYKTMKRYGG